MSLRSFRIPTLVVTISIIALVGYHRKAQQKTPSPTGVRVTSQMIEEARLTAMKNDKFLMVQFGASWCPDCLELSKSLNDVITSNRLEQHFVVVNVDVGEFQPQSECRAVAWSRCQSGHSCCRILPTT